MAKRKRSSRNWVLILSIFLVITVLLYGLGSLFSIEWMMLEFVFEVEESGFEFYLGSLVPPIIGLFVAFLAEDLYRKRMTSAPS